MNPRIRLRHIRLFLETARLGSLGAAADSLHISQPAASKTLRELEDILCTALFDRSGRRLELNRAGRLFQQHASSAMVALDQAEDSVRRGGAERSVIAVGLLPSVSSDLFPRAALAFHSQHPNALIRVMTGPNWQLLGQLRQGELDLVVGRMAAPEQMTGLSFHHLYTERVIIAVRAGHPALQQPFTPDTLRRYPVILPPKGALISAVVRSYLLRVGAPNIEPMFENVSLAFARRVLELSDALWFISRGVVRHDIETGLLAEIPPADEILAGSIGYALRESAPPSETLSNLLETLQETARLQN